MLLIVEVLRNQVRNPELLALRSLFTYLLQMAVSVFIHDICLQYFSLQHLIHYISLAVLSGQTFLLPLLISVHWPQINFLISPYLLPSGLVAQLVRGQRFILRVGLFPSRTIAQEESFGIFIQHFHLHHLNL